jgi:hypothetical protein
MFLDAFEKLQLLALSCLSVHMEQLGSHRTDFQESLYLRIFQKSVEKMPRSSESDQAHGYFTCIPMYTVLSISFRTDFF